MNVDIDLNDIEFEFEESFQYATFVSIRYKGENFFDNYRESLDEHLQGALLSRIKITGETEPGKWNPDIYEKLNSYKRHYCIRKKGDNSLRVSTTQFDLNGRNIILILGYSKKSFKSTKKIQQYYKKAQNFIDIIQKDKNATRKKLEKII
jgi:hypothetical protein